MDIKKALDSYKKDIGCAKCGFEDKYLLTILENTLDYINRLEAENERLKDYNENLLTANTALSNEILEAKAEAYKEFAERLKDEYTERFLVSGDILIEVIDNLLKEMVGE